MDICIRPFTDQDQAQARAVILESFKGRFGFIDETRNPDLQDIVASYLTPGHVFLVAEHAHCVVGTGALLIRPDAIGELVRVSTSHAYRRQGIARRICQQLIVEARQRGIHTLKLETNWDWYDAIRLYQKLGFHIHQRLKNNVHLEMNLSP